MHERHCGSLSMCERVFKFSDSCSLAHYNPTLLIPRSSTYKQKDITRRTGHISYTYVLIVVVCVCSYDTCLSSGVIFHTGLCIKRGKFYTLLFLTNLNFS